jgi:O-acetyl-ADP-ribose deacetylase (regulator of RNase III)
LIIERLYFEESIAYFGPDKSNDRLLAVVVGDIVNADTDTIVDEANAQLARGVGVCGAVFWAAGSGLGVLAEIICPPGQVP